MKSSILTLSIMLLALVTGNVYSQNQVQYTSYEEQQRLDSLKRVEAQQAENANKLETLEEERKQTSEEAKEARRKAKEAEKQANEAKAAARESKDALRAEKKAQKLRKRADRQARKAEKAQARLQDN